MALSTTRIFSTCCFLSHESIRMSEKSAAPLIAWAIDSLLARTVSTSSASVPAAWGSRSE